MTVYTAIPNGDTAPGQPITTEFVQRLRDNPLAIQEGDPTAPKIVSAALADYPWGAEDLRDSASGTTYLCAAADTEQNTTSASATKVKEITIPYGGSITATFDIRIDNGTGYAQIYINGSPFGSSVSTGNTLYGARSITITGLSAGDRVQLYIWHPGAAAVYIRNFRLNETSPPTFFVVVQD